MKSTLNTHMHGTGKTTIGAEKLPFVANLQDKFTPDFFSTMLADVGNILNRACVESFNAFYSVGKEARSDLYYRVVFLYINLLLKLQHFTFASYKLAVDSEQGLGDSNKMFRDLKEIFFRNFGVDGVADPLESVKDGRRGIDKPESNGRNGF